jgi:hypothetical protein
MFGIDWANPETLWLNVTNVALGLVALACVVAIGLGVVQELWARYRSRVQAPADDHAFEIPGLGWTMADGGEPVTKKDEPETPKES